MKTNMFSLSTEGDDGQSGNGSMRDPCEICFSLINVIVLIVYTIIFVVAVGGNILVCCVVLGQKGMKTVTNLFLLNLAIGDMAKGLICIPFTFVVNVLVPYWPFGLFMCPLLLYTQVVVVFVSAFTLVVMSIDRYVAIIHPLRPKLTTRKVIGIIIMIWICALAVPLPTVIYSHVTNPYTNHSEECQRGLCLEDIPNSDYEWRHIYSMAIMCLQYFVPLAVLVFTYSKIGYIIWIKRTPGEAEQRRDARIASAKKKMVNVMIVVVVIYAFCWLPLHALKLIEESHPAIYDYKYFQVIWNCFQWLAMSYACYNPIVYFWMNKRFRKGFKGIIFRCSHCKKQFGQSVSNGRRSHLPQRNNSQSSSRYSPRGSLDETKIMKMSFLNKGDCDVNDL